MKLYIINIKSKKKKLKEYYITIIIFSLMHFVCNFLIGNISFSFFLLQYTNMKK